MKPFNYMCFCVDENCENPESFGTICVRCNKCGRFTDDKVIYVTQEQMREWGKWNEYYRTLLRGKL